MSIKKLCLSVLLGATVLCTSLEAFASESNDTRSDVYIDIWLEKNIATQPGDVFEITYHSEGSNEPRELVIDLTENVETIPMDAGAYVVTDIEYKGANDEIEACGYGTISKFVVESGDDAYNEFILAVGTDYGNKLSRLYADTLLKQNSAFVKELSELMQGPNGELVVSETGEAADEEKETTAATVDETQETYIINTEPNEKVENTEPGKAETVAETVTKKLPDDYSSRLLKKGIPLIILSGIVAIALLKIYKNNN